MQELRSMCEQAGFAKVQTYKASGNVVFESGRSEAEAKSALEKSLAKFAGKPVGVLVRTAAEMAAVKAANPFPNAAPNRAVAIFLDKPPAGDALDTVTGMNGEEVKIGTREIYVHYGNGMAGSKLNIPAAKAGTARNMNTIAKLAEMAGQL